MSRQMPDYKGFLCSVQFSHSVVSNSLWPHRLQQASLPCPSPIPEACSNACPSSRWCYPSTSSSDIPFSSSLQSFPESGSFPMSQWITLGGQSIGVSVLDSVLPINIQVCYPLGLTSFRTDWLDLLAVQETLKSLLQHYGLKASILQRSVFFMVQLSHPYMTTGRAIALAIHWQSDVSAF